MTRAYLTLLLIVLFLCWHASAEAQWQRHTIDNSSRGADGIRLADFNSDGRLDMVTGWEEGGIVRVYLQPDSSKVREPWPAVTVGKVASPEDAVAADIDGDGQLDVLSSCEGRNRSLYFHWSPNAKAMLEPTKWKTDQIPIAAKKQLWMFALPMQIDGKNGVDFFVAAKGGAAWISWLESPTNPRDVPAWRINPIHKVGWVMSLLADDLDEDGDPDVLVSDRKGEGRGILWLENPGPNPPPGQSWSVHYIADDLGEVMFLSQGDIDNNGTKDIVCAVKGRGVAILHRQPGKQPKYETTIVPLPPNSGTAKSAAIADIDGDGKSDLIYSCENANGQLHGVRWGSYQKSSRSGHWKWTDVSGPEGVKFDLLQLIDLDHDGDLDIATCEERANLGVIWYENPALFSSLK